MAITLDGSDNKIAIGANATGSAYVRLYEDTDNGTNYVDIIAPASITSNRTLTLPDATGTIITTAGGAAISGTTGAFTTTVGVGGATPAASGAGITFPATASASSDANTLDDYEEGTWTPAYATGFSAVVYAARTGTYTKIGRFVQLNLFIDAGTVTASGNITISGLPFATGSYSQNNYIGVVQVQATSGTLAAGNVLMRIADASSTLFLQTQSTTGVASMAGSQLGSNHTINATISYITAT